MKIKIYKIIYFISVFTITYISFISSNTDNPVSLNYSNVQRIHDFIPQGWAFFTRNPREDVVKLYKIENSRLVYVNNTSSLSFEDLFGIKRHKRHISAELSDIIININKTKEWHEFRNTVFLQAVNTIQTSDTIVNKFKKKLLTSGEYVIYSSRRMPWAWESSAVNLPYKLKKIYIK